MSIGALGKLFKEFMLNHGIINNTNNEVFHNNDMKQGAYAPKAPKQEKA